MNTFNGTRKEKKKKKKTLFKLQPINTVCVSIPEKAMTPYSSTLAWKIPWMEEAGGLQSMRSQRVGHD